MVDAPAAFSLRPAVACALFDDRAVVLDMTANRYRLVRGRKAAALSAIQKGKTTGDTEALAALAAERIVVPRTGPTPVPPPLSAPEACAAELPFAGTVELAGLTVARSVSSAIVRIRIQSLPRVLSWARSEGQARYRATDPVALAQAFDHRRMLVPFKRVCLRDALAFRRIAGDAFPDLRLVLGVRLDPFDAHCWVQHRGIVLTDALATARDMRPILVL